MTLRPDNRIHLNTKEFKYSLKDMVKDLSCYTLIPDNEIAKLIKILFQLILFNVYNGKRAQIYMFGMFEKKHYASSPVNDRLNGIWKMGPERDVLRFTPYPFTRWLYAPHKFGVYKKYKQPWYYMFIDKLKCELYHHWDKLNGDKAIPPFMSEEIESEYKRLSKIKHRPFSQLR